MTRKSGSARARLVASLVRRSSRAAARIGTMLAAQPAAARAGRRRRAEARDPSPEVVADHGVRRVGGDVLKLVRVGAEVVELVLAGRVRDVGPVLCPDRAIGRHPVTLDARRREVLDEDLVAPLAVLAA